MLTFTEASEKHFGDEAPLKARMEWLENSSSRPTLEQFSKITLPYQTTDELPAPIPTAEEIEKVRGTINDLTAARGHLGYYPVYRLHGVYAVKLSRTAIILQEAENLLFLAQHSKIRVPKVYAVFSHQGCDPQGLIERQQYTERSQIAPYFYLVMEYVPGKNCQSEEDWNVLSEKVKTNICRKVGQQLNLLQTVPAPSPSYYGRINNQPFRPGCPTLIYSSKGFHGPYHSHEDFITAVQSYCEESSISSYSTDFAPESKIFLESFLRDMENALGQESRLTHPDLKPQNVIVQPMQDDPEDCDVVLIDWAEMAWLPAYVQAATVLRGCPNSRDRHLYAWEMSQGLKPFPHETGIYYNLALPAMMVHLA